MLIRLLLFASLFVSLAVPARAEVRVAVTYSEAANLFFVMDNVSAWLDGFTDPAFRAEWIKRFGWSTADQAMADRYREYRARTYIDSQDPEEDPGKSSEGMFAARGPVTTADDPLAAYFMRQTDIRNALRGLDGAVTAKDARLLRAFYQHFEPRSRQIMDESRSLQNDAAALGHLLASRATDRFADRMSKYYGVETDGTFTVLFVHYPAGQRSRAGVLGGKFILLKSPVGSKIASDDWDTIVFHEFAHYISALQPAKQKRILTRQFLAACSLPKGVNPLWLLEEPLAVAWGQATYSLKVRGRPFNPLENWYSVPWIDIVSRTIAPSVALAYDNGATINDGVVKEPAARCNDLKAISDLLNSPEKK